jgi:hypothetical protein
VNTRLRSVWRKIGITVAALGIMAGSTVAGATGASAAGVGELTCKSEADRYNICFSITRIGVGSSFAVHVGIDVHMSQQDAENIINAPGQEFSAKIWADDPIWDNALKNIPVTWVAAGPEGLGAEFDTVMTSHELDEDSDGGDELYSVVKLYIPSTGDTRSFTSHNVNGRF